MRYLFLGRGRLLAVAGAMMLAAAAALWVVLSFAGGPGSPSTVGQADMTTTAPEPVSPQAPGGQLGQGTPGDSPTGLLPSGGSGNGDASGTSEPENFTSSISLLPPPGPELMRPFRAPPLIGRFPEGAVVPEVILPGARPGDFSVYVFHPDPVTVTRLVAFYQEVFAEQGLNLVPVPDQPASAGLFSVDSLVSGPFEGQLRFFVVPGGVVLSGVLFSPSDS